MFLLPLFEFAVFPAKVIDPIGNAFLFVFPIKIDDKPCLFLSLFRLGLLNNLFFLDLGGFDHFRFHVSHAIYTPLNCLAPMTLR